MKKLFFIALAIFSINIAEAKKVKFSVDMTGQVLNPNGIHITSDFQVVAGFGGNNWDCGVIQLAKEATDTNIYSIVVDIPAFQKYEYKFVNGEFCYEVEVVPESAAANYNFSDNRWIYVDSLSNDTLKLDAVLFNLSAPIGKSLVRYKINMMQEASISPSGVHVAGNFNAWDPTASRLYSFSNNVYEWISYVNNGAYEFKYYNGNLASNTETVPGACASSGNRSINVVQDTVLSLLCFSSCNMCYPSAIEELDFASQIIIAPNPMKTFTTIQLNDATLTYEIALSDITGKILYSTMVKYSNSVRIENKNFNPGIYLLKIKNSRNQQKTIKLIIE